jgi:hypothetical protein
MQLNAAQIFVLALSIGFFVALAGGSEYYKKRPPKNRRKK